MVYPEVIPGNPRLPEKPAPVAVCSQLPPTLQAEMKREGDEHPHLDANHGLQACGLKKKEQQQKGICFLVSGWWFSFKFSDFRDQRDYSGFSMVLVDFCLTGADRDEHFWVRNGNFT